MDMLGKHAGTFGWVMILLTLCAFLFLGLVISQKFVSSESAEDLGKVAIMLLFATITYIVHIDWEGIWDEWNHPDHNDPVF